MLRGDARRSALLLGYVEAQYTAVKAPREALEQQSYDKLMAALSETLSEDEITLLARSPPASRKRSAMPSRQKAPRLARPRSRGRMRRVAGERPRSKGARPIQSPARCGEPVEKRRHRHCEACIPQARRAHGLRAIEIARKVPAAQTAAGNDPRQGGEVDSMPKLDAFSLKEMGKATGLSLAACSRIRAGVKMPHPRHRDALLALVQE